MRRVLHRSLSLPVALLLSTVALGACTVQSSDDQKADTATASAPPVAAPATADTLSPTVLSDTGMRVDGAQVRIGSTMRIEVDVKARQLHVYEGERRTATHPVAVGSAKWPTRTGEWTITQVVFNPEWIPPDESWAEEREPRKPGDPKNPLGRAQLVYDPPRSIHGTNLPSSIGQAVSHGSIRMRNETILQLAQHIMDASGAGKDEAWYRSARENTKVKQIVRLPRPVPIRVF